MRLVLDTEILRYQFHEMAVQASARSDRRWRFVTPYDLQGEVSLLAIHPVARALSAMLRDTFIAHHLGAPLVAVLLFGAYYRDRFESAVRAELVAMGLPGDDVAICVVPDLRVAGDVLMETLDQVVARHPHVDPALEPVRLPIEDRFYWGDDLAVSGTLASGRLLPGDRVELVGMGSTLNARVRQIQKKYQELPSMERGEWAEVILADVPRDAVKLASTLSSPGVIQSGNEFSCRVHWFEKPDGDAPLTLYSGPFAVGISLRPEGDDRYAATTAQPVVSHPGTRYPLYSPTAVLGAIEITARDRE